MHTLKYGCWHNFETFWSLDNLWMLEFPDVEYNDADEDQSVDVLNKLLNYPSAPLNNLYPPRVEDSITENDTAADEAVRLMYVFAVLILHFILADR